MVLKKNVVVPGRGERNTEVKGRENSRSPIAVPVSKTVVNTSPIPEEETVVANPEIRVSYWKPPAGEIPELKQKYRGPNAASGADAKDWVCYNCN